MNKLKLIFFSAVTLVFLNGGNVWGQCYTTSTPENTCDYGDAIDAFTFAGVTTNNSGCQNDYYSSTPGYVSFSTPVRNLNAGQTYSYTASVGSTGSNPYYQGFAMWIDLNNNGQYESSEMLVNSASALNHSGNVTIPSTATGANNVRMRIRCAYNGSTGVTMFSGSNACTDYVGNYGETEDYLVNICAGPTITVQPPTSRSFCNGGSVSLGITATNAASYRWQVNTGSGFANISDNGNYSGSTTAGLVISNAPTSFNTYSYRCVATSACAASTNSSVTTINLMPSADITAHTASAMACVGSNTSIDVTASNAVGYQWQAGSSTSGYINIADDAVYSGTNSAVLNITEAPSSIAGLTYRCIVTGACNYDTTAIIPLNLLLTPEILEHPKDVLVKTGINTTFTVKCDGHGTPLNYIWQASYDDVTFHTIYANSLYQIGGDVLEVMNITKAQGGLHFRCIIKGAGSGCGTFYDTSSSAQLIIDDPLSINTVNNEVDITLYPNPVSGTELFIRTTGNIDASSVRITDKLGRTVYSSEVTFSSNVATVPVANLTPGIYSLQLFDKEKNVVNSSTFTKQ